MVDANTAVSFLAARASALSPAQWWWLVDIFLLLLLLVILYVFTHPTLSFSSSTITQRRGPFHVSIDLNNLESVRVNTTVRRNRVIDPQTGEERQANFYYQRPDDWAGKTPAQGFDIRDSNGHHLSLRFSRTRADYWGQFLLHAVKAQPLLELGPGVMETLERVTR
jgi:hypothetical protein